MTLVFLVAAFGTLLAAAAVVPLLRSLRVIDTPNARSSHRVAVVRGGGLACMVGAVGGVVLGAPGEWLLLVVPLTLGLVGFADDMRGLPAGLRLAVQAGAALAALYVVAVEGDVRLTIAVVGLVFFVALVNAFNFMDGVNGISGLTAAVIGVWFWWVGERSGLGAVSAVGAVLVGVSLGFLPWNAPKARLFLGDSGSYFLGGLVAMAAWVVASQVSVGYAFAPVVIYLADTGWTMARRARRDLRGIMTAHREHVYQQLADVWGHVAAASFVAALSALVCVLAWRLGVWAASVSALLLVVAYLNTPAILRRRVR